jgi:hypothetical protein
MAFVADGVAAETILYVLARWTCVADRSWYFRINLLALDRAF